MTINSDRLRSTITGQEIYAQPEAWAGALQTVRANAAAVKELADGKPAVFCGCGTSYYLAIAAARTYQETTGLTARAIASSELFLSPAGVLAAGHNGPLFAISRSGETSETVMAARFYQEQGFGPVIAVTGRGAAPLSTPAALTLELPWADDQSVVMTRSFTTMLLACWAVAGVVAGDDAYLAELERLPAMAAPAIEAALPLAAQLGQDLSRTQFIFLGQSAYFGMALEGMLKLKEMTQVRAEAYSPLDFRHGPIAIAGEGTTAILLCTEAGTAFYQALLADIRNLGAAAVAVGYPTSGMEADLSLPLGEGLSDRSRGLLYMPLLQLLGLERALTLGLEPDRPQKLNRVVRLT